MANRLPPSQRPNRRGADPGPEGPPGLQRWIMNYGDHWQSFYREARRLNWPADMIVAASPTSDRTDEHPVHFAPIPRVNRGILTRRIPSIHKSFDKPAPPGMFYVLATKSSGRLKGTYVGLVNVPDEGVELPDLALTCPPPPPTSQMS